MISDAVISDAAISHAAAAWHAAAASPASTNDITPGVLGFLVIAAMGGVLVLLLRSMNKHLRRVRAVRDAGLAPGSELGSTGVSQAARAAANGAASATSSVAGDGTGPAASTDPGETGR